MRLKPSYPRLRRGNPLNSGLLAAVPFHEGSGRPIDLVSQEGLSDVMSPSWTVASAGAAYNLQGSAGVSIPNINLGTSLPFSYHIRFVIYGVTSTFTYLMWHSGSSTPSPVLYFISSTTQIAWGCRSGVAVNGTTLSVGTENSVVGTYSGGSTGTQKIFVNGLQIASGAVAPLPMGSGAMQIGYRDGSSFPLVDCLDVRVWNREVSNTEVAEIHHDPFSAYRQRTKSYLFLLSSTPPATLRRRQHSQLIGSGIV